MQSQEMQTVQDAQCYNCSMKLLRSLSTLPTWQKVVIATIVIAVPAGLLLGPVAYRWFTQKQNGK